MPGKTAPVACPKCGGPCWNNIDGKRNPKAPDYACKNKEGCGAGVWLTDSEKNAARATAGTPAGNGTKPANGVILEAIMYHSIESAQKIAANLFKEGEVTGLSDDLILNMATTMFIARARGEGILLYEKPKPASVPPAAPPPPPPPPAVPEAQYADPYTYDPDLPFR